MDHDPQAAGIAFQPFWLHWHNGVRSRPHAPNYFVRLAYGRGRVVDVRADDRLDEAAAASFEVTEQACRALGWEFVRAECLIRWSWRICGGWRVTGAVGVCGG